MTFEEVESQTPNGFHDAKIDKLSVDYRTGTLSLSLRLHVGTPGMPDQEDYGQAELRVNRLLFCAIEPPDPGYPFAPDGSGCLLKTGIHSSIFAGSDVQLRWNLRDVG